jgi:sugar phosphate isomerase/epimerase
MTAPTVALELYTVRDELERDFAGTLRRVAAMGYPAVEGGHFRTIETGEMKALLDETGLQMPAVLFGLPALEADLDAEIDYCRAIESSYLVLSWVHPAQFAGEVLPALARRLNELGRRYHERGLVFGYHNHDHEFAQRDGAYLLDYLLDATDPVLVMLELDVYWAAYAGADPAAYLRRRAGRVPLLHLKDMAADRSFADVGDGTLDLPGIFTAAEDCGARWYVVENDRPRMPSLESARRSLENLRAMGKA